MDVAQALLVGRPLKREVEPVLAQVLAAVERLVRTGLDLHPGALERRPLPALPKLRQRGQPTRFE